jgi:hypothetical protein
MARPIRRLAVTLPLFGALLLFTATGPAAAASGSDPPGNGDPHAADAAGNPHAPDAPTGNPHAVDSTDAGSDSTAAPASTDTSSSDTGTTTESSATTESASTSSNSTTSSESVATESVSTAAKPTGQGGKPCDGCAGNADGKEPPGQSNRPSDSNKGHKCDGNKGVGKGNPAHTGCATTTTTTTTTTDNTTPTTDTTTPTTSTTTPSTQVLGETISRGSTQVLGATATRAGALARTGSDLGVLTVLGVGLLLSGAVLVRRAKMAVGSAT